MLDIKKIRQNPDLIKELLSLRNPHYAKILNELLEIDKQYREKLIEKESLEAERNMLSKLVGEKKSKGENTDSERESLNSIKEKLKAINGLEPILAEKQQEFLLELPNIPSSDTPYGKDENDNKFIMEWGTKPSFSFQPLEHNDLGNANQELDFERGVKLSKSRFTVIAGKLAKLERALINFMLDKATENGYQEYSLPVIVNSDSLYGTGNLPKFKDDLFKIEGEELYLIPTAEVPLTNLHRNEILKEEQLPLRMTAYTPCFRSEAGSAGKDTRGIIRQHQFNKIELVILCKEEEAIAEHERLTNNAESILQALELPYRKVQLCAGDLGFSASKCYDLEVWFPSQEKYREISSCSWFSDFQARRTQIRFKRTDESGKSKNEFVHTINGSGLAVGRTLAAIMENYQTEDGEIIIPKALRPYLKQSSLV
ncbi:MAG: serine--tRNA ligase [Cyanobacteria bacterium REEB446]|nr:serine--tRNA ligase [Cyanobacteria bacterium REEB446]